MSRFIINFTCLIVIAAAIAPATFTAIALA